MTQTAKQLDAYQIPHDANAEEGVIGSIILGGSETMEDIAPIVKSAEYFFVPQNGFWFQACMDLFNAGKPIDATIITEHMRRKGTLEEAGGAMQLRVCYNNVPNTAHAVYYAAIVSDQYHRRRMISELTACLRDAYESETSAEKLYDRTEQRIFAVTEKREISEAVMLADVVYETMEEIYNPKPNHTAYTGLIELDGLTGGMRDGQMIVLAARPSHGKTALAWTIAENVAIEQKLPVAFFSLEMNRSELATRAVCSRSMVNARKFNNLPLADNEQQRVNNAISEVSQARILIDDTPGISAMEFRAKARKLVRKHGVRLIVLDYLQLMTGQGSNRQEEVSAISRIVKATARELKVPILALSQLNRANESEGRLPRTSDLRESGSIEQDADCVWLLHREAVTQRGNDSWFNSNPELVNLALLIVGKQRNGPCDSVKLVFLAGQTRFVNHNPGV